MDERMDAGLDTFALVIPTGFSAMCSVAVRRRFSSCGKRGPA